MDTVGAFNRLYYNQRIWSKTYWLGVPVLKCPLDLWIYQEVLHRTKPDLIVETGTHLGGSALYLATVCDALRKGHVVSIDVEAAERPAHKRITYLHGSSTDPDIVRQVHEQSSGRVMVILDSDHRRDHVLAEFEAYSDLVTLGCYLIVEDTNDATDLYPNLKDNGPKEAIEAFLSANANFEADALCEKFLLTFPPGGYLRRVSATSAPQR